MNELRAKPGDLCMADAMPFQQHYEYRTTDPVGAVIHDKFFLPVAGNLRPGDQVTICRYDSGAHDCLIELGTVRVIEKAHDEIRLFQIGEVSHIQPPKPTEADAVEPVPGFIQGDGAVKWNIGTMKHDVVLDGVVIASCDKKEDALAIAGGQVPIPEAA